MAVALILRNASKIQAGTLQNLVKVSPFAVIKDLSPSLCNKYHSTLTKQNHVNLSLAIPKSRVMVSPQSRFMSEDHSKLWPIERAVSIGLAALIPAAVASPHFILDNVLAVAVVAHFHWGLEAVVVDYVRPIIVGNVLAKLTLWLLYLISATTLGGLLYYNINDIGIGKTIRKLWESECPDSGKHFGGLGSSGAGGSSGSGGSSHAGKCVPKPTK